MVVTNVTIKLRRADRLLVFATIEIDGDFVVRDIKIIDGLDGRLFLAMPSRKVTDRCPQCGGKNPLIVRYCSECGRRLPRPVQSRKFHADIVHPITAECRAMIEQAVFKAYAGELERSKKPGYVFPPRSGQTSTEMPAIEDEPPKKDSKDGFGILG